MDKPNIGHLKPSARGAIDPFIVMEVMRRANEREAAGENIIHMEVGQPSTSAPRLAREAAHRAIDSDRLGYTDALGIAQLRARIAQHYRDAYGLEIAPQRIIVTTGSSAGFVLSFLALFDPGARVGLPAPGYPCYRHILSTLGITPVIIPARTESRWMPDAAALGPQPGSDTPDGLELQGLLIASPSNPTGTMLSPGRLERIVETCRQHGINFISDEIYHGLCFDAPAATALKFSDDVVVVNSFSKYFSMTGWRIGWLVVPDNLVKTIERIAQNFYISAPSISQHVALAAFDAVEELEGFKQVYATNRDLLLDALPSLGFDDIAPADGAFYLYADTSKFTDNSLTFANQMLAEIGIAVTPGLDFDAELGHRYLRFSYARSTDDMHEAVRRLKGWQRISFS